MPDDIDTSTESTETTETPAETPSQTAGESTEVKETGEPELDLDGAKSALAKARNEAGKYRTRLRDAESKLASAKTVEEFETATKELRETNAKLERDLLVSTVARTAKLPNELAELLQGSTKEELEAHAKKLQKFVTPDKETTESLRGGLDPNDEDSFDPVKVAHAAKRHRY